MASDDLHDVWLILFVSWLFVMRVVVSQSTSDVLCFVASDLFGRLCCKCSIHLLQSTIFLNCVFVVLFWYRFVMRSWFISFVLKKIAESEWPCDVPIVVALDSMT